MGEGATSAPASPAAAPSSTPAPSNGASGAQTPASVPSKPAQGRGPHGQYLPRQGADVPAPERAEAPPAPQPHYRARLKVDGREEEAVYQTPEELQRELQMARGAAARMREAAEIKKSQAEADRRLKEDAEAWLAEKGVDVDALAAKRLAEKARKALMSPEAREAYELRHQQTAQQKELEQLRAEKRERLANEHAAAVWKEMEPRFLAAAERHGLAQDPALMTMIAEVGGDFADAGLEVDPEAVMAEVARRDDARTWERVRALPLEHLVKRLGADVVRQISAAEAKRVLEARKGQTFKASGTAQPEEKPAGPRQFVDPLQFKKSLFGK